MEATQTPSSEHTEFDRLCEQVDEFDHLPAVVSPVLDPDDPDEHGDEPELDQVILAGLVSPV